VTKININCDLFFAAKSLKCAPDTRALSLSESFDGSAPIGPALQAKEPAQDISPQNADKPNSVRLF